MNKIFILHGWAYSVEKWEPFLKILAAQGFKTELLTIPGLTERLDQVWNLDDYVQWLHQILKKEDPVILLGHSNGGRIALAYVAKYQTKLKRLILIDSAGIYHNELPIRIKRALFKVIAKVGKKLTASDTMKKLLYTLAHEQDYQQATPQLRQTMTNLISQDLQPVLPQIKIPTLIIWGQADQSTPLSDGKLMHQLIKDSKLQVIAAARHSPHFSHPQEVAKIIYETI